MTIVLFCYRVLNDSTCHTKHENLPECGLHKVKSRKYATKEVTPRATWKVKPSISSSWWQPLCSFWVSRNKYWLILRKENNNNINIFYYWTNSAVRTAIFHIDGPPSVPLLTAVEQLAQPRSVLTKRSLSPILILSCHFLLSCAFLTLTIFCNMLSASPFSAASCIIQLRGRYSSFGCCKCCGHRVSEDVIRGRRKILWYEISGKASGWDGFLKYQNNNY